jgi:cell division septal protein FtsQ
MRPDFQKRNFSLEHVVRRKHLRRQRKIKALILLVVLAVLGWVIGKPILTSPYFEIKVIRVEGTNRLSREKILKWADIPSGQSIFQLNSRRIVQKISSSSLVKRVEVKRILPSTVLIRVEERMPFVYLFQKDSLYEVDDEGVVLGRGKRTTDLPMMVGSGWSSRPEKIKLVVRILHAAEELELSFSKIKMDNKGSMVGYLKNGPIIYLGESPHLAYLSYLPLVLAAKGSKGRDIKYVDIRFRDQIVVGTE